MINKITSTAIFILALQAQNSYAQDSSENIFINSFKATCGTPSNLRATFNLGSIHLTDQYEPNQGYNEKNYGFGLDILSDKRKGFLKSEWRSYCGISYYKNSIYRSSIEVHTGAEILVNTPLNSVNLTLGAQLGAVTGYREGISPIPYAAPTAGIEIADKIFARSLILPKVNIGDVGSDAVVGFQAGVRVKF